MRLPRSITGAMYGFVLGSNLVQYRNGINEDLMVLQLILLAIGVVGIVVAYLSETK